MTKYHKKMTISELLDMVRGGQGKDALLARTEIENTINRLIGIQDNVEFFCNECGGLSVAVEEYEAQTTQKANTISESK